MQSIINAWYIFRKDLKQEFRTRYALNTIVLFSVVTLTAISFSIGGFVANQDILCALLWVILFFSAMSGLSHIFIREEESRTAETLKLIVEPISVFVGKLIFNLILLFLLEIVIIPLFFAVMNFGIKNFWMFISTVILGSIGLSAAATIIAAMVAKASSKGALYTVLSFPILLPVLITGINATKIASRETNFSAISAELQVLFAYAVVIITASIMLFEFIWND